MIGRKKYVRARELLEGEIKKRTERSDDPEWGGGYYHALKGMLSSMRSDGRKYSFIKNMDYENIGKIENEFREYATSTILKPFDRGFFTAWLHYVRTLLRTPEDKRVQENPKQQP